MFISDHVGLKRLKGLVGVNGFNTSTDWLTDELNNHLTTNAWLLINHPTNQPNALS
jgi:hypothetical protein